MEHMEVEGVEEDGHRGPSSRSARYIVDTPVSFRQDICREYWNRVISRSGKGDNDNMSEEGAGVDSILLESNHPTIVAALL